MLPSTLTGTHTQSTGTHAHMHRHRRRNMHAHVKPREHTCAHSHAEAYTVRHMQLRLLRTLLPHPSELCDGLPELEFRISVNTDIMW